MINKPSPLPSPLSKGEGDFSFTKCMSLRGKQAEQSAEQPAEMIGCLQDKSAGSESRLMRGAVNTEVSELSITKERKCENVKTQS